MNPRRYLALGAALCVGAADAPPAIHLDQLGFQPNGPKQAVVASPAAGPLAWQLRDGEGRVVAQGRTEVGGDDAASGDHVHRLDLGRVETPGAYRLSVGAATTPTFRIAANVFAPLARAALNYFYQTRAGTPIDARFAGGDAWARPAGHPHEVARCFSGADERGNQWPGCPGYARDVTGGWYDAGDQGKYVVNGGIALWTLQNLFEQPIGAGHPFPDGTAQLPEAGNGRNDLLDETRWEMDFLLAMQVPDGRHMAVPVGPQPRDGKLTLQDVDVGGMAHHKLADRHWTGLPTPPHLDREERLLFPPSTAATLNLAATAAQCARIWRTTDPAFAARCLAAARRAYAAARRHPDLYAAQTFTGSGGYGDANLSDEFYWAAAELFATTGERGYREDLTRAPAFGALVAEPGWPSTAALGTMTLATVPNALPPAEISRLRQAITAAATGYLAEERRTGYRIPFAGMNYTWGSNSVLLNRAMLLALAARFTGEARYRDAVVDVIDYLLGRNPLGQSYVSGFGWKPLQNPHHRFWAHQLDPKLPGPPPGVLSGGPNSTSLADPVAVTLKGQCAPQRCWRDDINAYALNEVAINWNAPLVWVATYLDRTR